jgi:CheY-like chemotaxis protein
MKNRPSRPWRVLLVEDDDLNLELVQAVLEAAGYAVLLARDARCGIEIARRERPDAVLMDVQMPQIDGLEATRALHADPATAGIPVIAVTAHAKKEDEQRCLEAGCILHLTKPLDTRALPEIVERVIAASREHAT